MDALQILYWLCTTQACISDASYQSQNIWFFSTEFRSSLSYHCLLNRKAQSWKWSVQTSKMILLSKLKSFQIIVTLSQLGITTNSNVLSQSLIISIIKLQILIYDASFHKILNFVVHYEQLWWTGELASCFQFRNWKTFQTMIAWVNWVSLQIRMNCLKL